MANEVVIDGLKELTKQLDDLGERGSRMAVRGATTKTMRKVRDDAKDNARGHGLVDTGTLVRSIKTRAKSRKTYGGYWYRTTVGFTGDGFYGSFFENGAKQLDGVKPMILPAFQKAEPDIPRVFQQELEKEIKRVSLKGKR